MAINLNNSLLGLSMLTGTNYLSGDVFGSVESAAVRAAKKLFTTPTTTAPWNEPASKTPVSIQISNIKRLPTIIDTTASSTISKLPDVQTSFTTYKALYKLQLLAEFASKTSTSASERAQLQTAFSKGLSDLQTYLGKAPSDALNLSFGKPSTSAETVGIDKASSSGKVVGTGLLKERDGALQGITGNGVISIKVARSSGSETFTVNLANTPQPPTLDSIAAALNAAIASSPIRDSNGDPILNGNGEEIPRWASRFAVEKHDDKWGLVLNGQAAEKISLDQVGAPDALLVVSGQTGLDAPTSAKVQRIDDPLSSLGNLTSLGTLSAVDAAATEKAVQAAKTKTKTDTKTNKTDDAKDNTPADVAAALNARAVVTDADGFSYVVGTTAGDLGSQLSDGANDLFLTKLDSEGNVVWQRTLGAAGEAAGAAISIADNGDIVVAGTVKGAFNGSMSGDSDMLVARFDASGQEKFATSMRKAGNDTANAVTVGPDGSIYIGGRASSGNGDAFLVKLDATGKEVSRRTIDSGNGDSLTALSFDASGQLIALTREGTNAVVRKIDSDNLSLDLGSYSLGAVDASAIKVAASGEIIVAGATSNAVSGAQVNGLSGGRDGFVTRIDGALSGASTTYIGSSGDDQVDSIAFLGDDIYVGGRTNGAIDGDRRGAVDGFVGRIDLATGALESVSQFGRVAQRTETVQVAAAPGGSTIMGALGFNRGQINATESTTLTSLTSLRKGDSFSLTVNGGTAKKVTIDATETFATLTKKLGKILGSSATVTTPTVNGQQTLRITAKNGQKIELIAGPNGTDALSKLGMLPARLIGSTSTGSKTPKVSPGGNYGLNLNLGLNLSDRGAAAAALDAVKSAISMTQSAYRSLYWSDANANIVDGKKATISGGGSPYQQKQLANYKAALERLGG